MKMRKFFHIAAVMLSSLASMVAHGKAQETTTITKEKKGEGELTRHHREDTGASKNSGVTDADDPPHRSKMHQLAATDDDIKNSKHAASFSSYDKQQEDADDHPALKLDPALMEDAERTVEPLGNSSIVPQSAPPTLPGDEHSLYPWKREIVTTTFWIGETPTHNNPVPNSASCWDPHWAVNYGGNDSPESSQRTADYTPAAFIPGQNPFYIALPYNDMEHGTHKAEAAAVIRWFAKDYKGPGQSVCQGRWIAIRFGGKVCYAQWEDAGPFRTDHWQYVFGNERPRPNLNGGAGLDVSPAVRDFLGMNSTDVTDWKFVDFNEVPTGPWARYGENNTFVQNSRRAGSAVAEIIQDIRPLFHSILPDIGSEKQEVR
jgi:hypothetical protein